MTLSARRDPLRELAVLLRAPEPGTTNLAAHASECAHALGDVLRVPPKYLEALEGQDDRDVAPRLRRWVDNVGATMLDDRKALRAERSLRAASLVGASTQWAEERAILDVNLLLGDLLADRTMGFVSFRLPHHFPIRIGKDAEEILIERRTLVRVASVRRMFVDLLAFLDADGLHFRWRGGRGGYNWWPQVLCGQQRHRVLDVAIRPPRRPPMARQGAWLGDVLHDLGLLP